MLITIGDIANEIMCYSDSVEVTNVHSIPFIRAPLTNSKGIAKCYIYVIQMEDGRYTTCDIDDEIDESRLFPLGSISEPFVSEKEMIIQWLGHKDATSSCSHYSVRHNLTYTEFIIHFYGVLIQRGVIMDISSNLKRQLNSLGFTNEKIIRTINDEFRKRNCMDQTIGSFIDLVNIEHKPFVLDGLKIRELHCIRAKLRDLGFIASFYDNAINHIVFKKK